MAFRERLNRERQDISDLLTQWEKMPIERKRMVVGEIHFRSDELKNLSRELAWRISEPVSFMECIFLGLLVAIPILHRLLTWISDKKTGDGTWKGADPGFEF